MGCDIHLYTEHYSKGRWRSADSFEHCTVGGGSWLKQITPFLERGRNYDLFSILADVRNGRGFAGVNTGYGFVPISEPRGLPYGLSPETLREYEEWESDAHSESWLTLHELDTYDWQQTTFKTGLIPLSSYEEWSTARNTPERYAGDVIGNKVVKYSQKEAEKGITLRPELDQYVRVSWEVCYAEAAGLFYSKMLPALRTLGNPNDVRIIFWFDN